VLGLLHASLSPALKAAYSVMKGGLKSTGTMSHIQSLKHLRVGVGVGQCGAVAVGVTT